VDKKNAAAKKTAKEKQLEAISAWLLRHYKEWKKDKNYGEESARRFADSLGLKQAVVTAYLRGDQGMSGKMAIYLANRLDYEIFDILGWERPGRPSVPLEESARAME
jgi:hypothetical protein